MYRPNYHCEKCDIRLPKNRPLLVCSLCSNLKHYKCNMLSKNEALLIIDSGQMNYWTCQDCITTLFPATCEGILTTDDNTTSDTVSKIVRYSKLDTVQL